MSVKSYLVTGGAGFLGSALVRRLVSDGHRVRVLDDGSRGSETRLEGIPGDVTFILGDVRDAGLVLDASAGVDCVCHLASVNGTRHFYERPGLVLDVSVRGILNVLDACSAHGIRELLLISSSEVYQTPLQVPTSETVPLSIPDPLNPRYAYAGGKLISELLVLNYGRPGRQGRQGLDRALVVRPHNVYGPDMGHDHVIPELVTRAAGLAAEQPEGALDLPIQGNGSETRAFVHVDDFTDGLTAVLDQGEHMGIYHVGNDEETPIGRLVELIGRGLGRTLNLVPGPRPEGAPLRRCPDIGRVRALGYSPRIPLAEGLPAVIEWYVDHPGPGDKR